jgi:hypothetical protein
VKGLVFGVVVAADGDHKIGVNLEGCSLGTKHRPVPHRLAVGRSLGIMWSFCRWYVKGGKLVEVVGLSREKCLSAIVFDVWAPSDAKRESFCE